MLKKTKEKENKKTLRLLEKTILTKKITIVIERNEIFSTKTEKNLYKTSKKPIYKDFKKRDKLKSANEINGTRIQN